MVIGLTGNIGCGKSTLSNMFREKNIDVIDLDIISREIMLDKDCLDEIVLNFGENLRLKDNSLDRKKLGSIVFNDNEKLQKLNSITHPRIKDKVRHIIKKSTSKYIIVDGALLIEAKFLDLVDFLLLVTCDYSVQIDRITKRDNISIKDCELRINSQMKQEEKKKYANYIIDNSNDILTLKNKIDKFLCFLEED
ncbi:MAG: dephospho-CoA kinase [Peptostreptococcaceae bacterium]